MKPLILVIFSAIIIVYSSEAKAQDKTIEIDKLFTWATPSTPGCVCAVSKDGKVVYNKAFGAADLERDVPLSTNSVLDAGSVVKQFVAAAIFVLAEEKKISLSDDIRKFIPELPDYGHKISIDHLLTHTSGIRDWTGIKMLSNRDENALTMVLRQQGLNFKPGDEWSYSNSGYVLLKEIIARVSGKSFGAFAQAKLFDPLGMKSTTYRHDINKLIENRALAYEKKGDEWKLEMHSDIDRGGGGALFSTASDLLIWNDALTNNSLGKYVTEKIQEPARLNNGRILSYTRGLIIDKKEDGSKVIWHSGGAAGYQTVVSRIPDHRISIAIMCNSGDGTSQVGFAGRISKMFIPETNHGDQEIKPQIEIPISGLKNKEGLYISQKDGKQLHLTNTKNGLRIAGGPALIAVEKDKFRVQESSLFFMSEDEFELKFITIDQIEYRSMEGKTTLYNRVDPDQIRSDDLKVFTGLYESDEMKSAFQINIEKDMLMVCLDHTGRCLDFKAIDKDNFQWRRMNISFQRNAAGEVIALEYSNPVFNNVKFYKKD